MPDPERIRTVVHEPEFESELHALIAGPREALEFTEGAEYVLARDPRAGLPYVEIEPSVWVMPMAPVGGATVSLFYHFDAETV